MTCDDSEIVVSFVDNPQVVSSGDVLNVLVNSDFTQVITCEDGCTETLISSPDINQVNVSQGESTATFIEGDGDVRTIVGCGGIVDSVVAGTNVTVDSSDPRHPIVSSTGGAGGIESIVAGANITVDDTDPLNPIVSSSGGGGGAVDSVNGQTGVVVLTAADVGADVAGAAATAQSNSIAYTDNELLGYVQSVSAGTGGISVDNTDSQNPIISWAGAPGGIAIGDTIGNSPVSQGILYSDSSDLLANDLLTMDGGTYFGGLVPYTRVASTTVPGAYMNFIDASAFGAGTGMLFGMPDTDSIFMVGRQSDFTAYFRVLASGGVPSLFLGGATGIDGLLDMNTHQISNVVDPTSNQDAATKKYVDDNASSLSLEVDGTPNGDQTLLNLIAGTGITLTDDGFGGVTFDAAGGGGLSIGDPIGNSPIINAVLYVDPSGNLGNNTNFKFDETNNVTTFKKNSGQNTNIMQILNDTGSELVSFSTSNPTFLTDFRVSGPGSSNAIDFTASAAQTSGWNIGAGNDLMYFYGTANSITTIAMEDNGRLQLGAWNFASRQAWVQAYGGDNTIPTFAVRNASGQTVDTQEWLDSSGNVMAAITKNGGVLLASMADSAAENSTLYFSTDSSKPCWRDSGGTPHDLY